MPKKESESEEGSVESKEESEHSKSEEASQSGSESEDSSESEPEEKKKVTRKPPSKTAAKTKKTSTGGGGKKKKDPNAPKRPMSAYLIFTQEARPAIKAEMEKKAGDKVKVTDVLKALGAKWKTLTDKDKEPFDKKAKIDKERFEREKKSYVPPEDSSSDSDSSDGGSKKRKAGGKAASKKKRKKDPDAPKKPMTAYLLYANEQREKIKADLAKTNVEGEKSKVTDVMKVIGAKWKKETPEAKQKYDKLAANEKVKYQALLEDYNNKKKDSD